MKATDPGNFLLSLAVAIGTETARQSAGNGLVFLADPGQVANASLWVHDAVEARSTAVYSVLRTYGGNSAGGFVRMASMAVQCDTRGIVAGDVLRQSYQVHEALLDDDGHPASCWVIRSKAMDASGLLIDDAERATAGDWLVRLVRLNGVPGIVGRDEAARWMAVFNFDVRYERIPV